MYTATVRITINNFVTIPNGSIGATLTAPTDTSPPVNPPINPPVFSGDGQNQININVPPSRPAPVQLTFQLPDTNYVLLGLAFQGTNPKPTPNANSGAGRLEFRSISIQRDAYGSQLTVTDSCRAMFMEVVYDYVILVQKVGTLEIGVIDPDIETEGSEP